MNNFYQVNYSKKILDTIDKQWVSITQKLETIVAAETIYKAIEKFCEEQSVDQKNILSISFLTTSNT